MKAIALTAILWCAFFGGLNAQWQDDFSDGDFTANPTWLGNTNNYAVNNGLLKLNNTAPSANNNSALYTSSPISSTTNMEWRFMIDHNFDGSATNQSRVYFMSDSPALTYSGTGSAGVTGYFLLFGEALGGDVIRFYYDNGTSVALLASGVTSLVDGFQASVRITKSELNNWLIEADFNGGQNYSTEASATHNTLNSGSYFGIINKYTQSNSTDFAFDNFYVGPIQVDTTPPSVTSVTATSLTTLDVLFDEPVNSASANNPIHYNILTIGPAISATIDGANSALVHLTTPAFFANTDYELEVQLIADASGNVMTNSDIVGFDYFQPVQAAYGDVVFNEILADETPSVGMPDGEFVELFNRDTENAFNFQGWKFSDAGTEKVLPNFTIEPGGYVILCDINNAALFESFGEVIGISSFPSLNNDGDSLTIKDNNNQIIDIVVYSDDWFETSIKREGGWSLERSSEQNNCGLSSWHESISAIGGTPGSVNSINNLPGDTSPPSLASLEIINEETIQLTFSETMDTSGWSIPAWDVIPYNSISSAMWSTGLDAVTITLAFPLSPSIIYSLILNGIADCSGNIINSTNIDFANAPTPSAGDIIINEIMADGTSEDQTASPSEEFIEIFNRTNQLLDLSGLKVNNGFFTSQVLLQPDSFLIITNSNSNPIQFFAYPNVAFMDGFPGLTDTGTTIRLILENDTLETISYTLDYYNNPDKDDGGWSMERINPDDPCNSSDNWRACERYQGSSAGRTNSVLDRTTDVEAPQLLHVLSEPENAITLVFDEPLQQPGLNVMQWTVNGNAVDATSAYLSGDEYNELVLPFGAMDENKLYSFHLIGIDDCWSNMAMDIHGSFALPLKPVEGELIINEILYDPYEGGSDFIEIYNRSSHAVSLDSCAIADATNGEMNTSDFITERNLLLMPGSFLALARDGRELPGFYANTNKNAVWKVEGMSDFSSDDIAFLLLPNGNICDQVAYSSDFHFPLLNTTDGVSLERIHYNRPSNDATNWHSAAESAGFATPGIVNSQAVTTANATTEIGVEPEIFSPDNDGYNDVVTFSIQLEKPGFVGNVNIYNSEGRPVRYLMQNDLLSDQARISWDGISDDGTKAPIGIYVVIFEAFNTQGEMVAGKTSCVLAHSLD